jgi:hypothetical protein
MAAPECSQNSKQDKRASNEGRLSLFAVTVTVTRTVRKSRALRWTTPQARIGIRAVNKKLCALAKGDEKENGRVEATHLMCCILHACCLWVVVGRCVSLLWTR